jgi:hypothetical protein
MESKHPMELLLRLLTVTNLLLYYVNESHAATVIGGMLGNLTKSFVALQDFDLPRSCKTTGIIKKFLSWGDGRSDAVARGLIPLAIEMQKYSSLHRKILRSWEVDSPVRVIISHVTFNTPRLLFLSMTSLTTFCQSRFWTPEMNCIMLLLCPWTQLILCFQ